MKKRILVVLVIIIVVISTTLVSASAAFTCPSCNQNYYYIECGPLAYYNYTSHQLTDPVTHVIFYCHFNDYYHVTDRECRNCGYMNNGTHRHYVGSHEFECGSPDECTVCSFYLYN